MYRNKYPYTDFHELNLDWVIKEIVEFSQKIEAFQKIIDEFSEYVDILQNLEPRVTALEVLSSQFSRDIADLKTGVSNLYLDLTELDQKLTAEAKTRAAGDADLQRQIDEINAAMINIAALEKRMKLYTDQAIKASELRTDIKLRALATIMNTRFAEVMDYIEDIYEKLTHIATNVYNWCAYAYAEDGRISFDLNNKLLYHHLGNNLNAVEYCKLGLTADQYKAYSLTAENYLMYSRDRLHYDYVFMPVSGKRQNVSVALSECINHVYDTMTSSEYTLLDITADEYVLLDLTSFDYLKLDTNLDLTHRLRYSLNGDGLTAEEYEHLAIID